jgi:hypothetical protein
MARSRSCKARGVAGIVGLGALFAPLSAHAFCREVVETPPSGYDPTTLGCFTTDPEAGVLPQLFWRNQCVNFNLNRAASPKYIPLNTARLIADQAFAQWAAASCPGGGAPSILATEGEVVDCDGESQGHNNPIIFRDTGWLYTDSANAIGYTTLTVNLDTGEILGAEIEINTEGHIIVATTPPPSGAYDLQSILTHEGGHFLGLAHSADSTAVMYAFYHAGSTTLQPDDISGICSIYPPDGSRNTQEGPIAATTCNPAPILGFEDLCGSLDAGALATVSGTNGSGENNTAPSGDGGVGPLTENLWGCSIERTRSQGGVGFVAPGLFALGLLFRRKRLSSRRPRQRLPQQRQRRRWPLLLRARARRRP